MSGTSMFVMRARVLGVWLSMRMNSSPSCSRTFRCANEGRRGTLPLTPVYFLVHDDGARGGLDQMLERLVEPGDVAERGSSGVAVVHRHGRELHDAGLQLEGHVVDGGVGSRPAHVH